MLGKKPAIIFLMSFIYSMKKIICPKTLGMLYNINSDAYYMSYFFFPLSVFPYSTSTFKNHVTRLQVMENSVRCQPTINILAQYSSLAINE